MTPGYCVRCHCRSEDPLCDRCELQEEEEQARAEDTGWLPLPPSENWKDAA